VARLGIDRFGGRTAVELSQFGNIVIWMHQSVAGGPKAIHL